MTIAQIELQSFFLALLAAVLGFISAAAVDVIKDWNTRRRMRGALYREIGEMYGTLRWAVRTLNKPENTWYDLSSIFKILQVILRADTYTNVKTQPVSTFGIKDFQTISSVYILFSSFSFHLQNFGVNSEAFEGNTDDQISKLSSACEKVIDTVEGAIVDLDKQLLLAVSAGSGAQKELKELFKKVEKANT